MDSQGVAVLLYHPALYVPVPHQTVVDYERVVFVQYIVRTSLSDHVNVHWGRLAPSFRPDEPCHCWLRVQVVG